MLWYNVYKENFMLIGAIAGDIAEAFYGVPSEIEAKALTYLDADLLKIYKDVNMHFSKK